jgi:hypothetical protein
MTIKNYPVPNKLEKYTEAKTTPEKVSHANKNVRGIASI